MEDKQRRKGVCGMDGKKLWVEPEIEETELAKTKNDPYALGNPDGERPVDDCGDLWDAYS